MEGMQVWLCQSVEERVSHRTDDLFYKLWFYLYVVVIVNNRIKPEILTQAMNLYEGRETHASDAFA